MISSQDREENFLSAVVKLARYLGWNVDHLRKARTDDRGFPDLAMARERVIFADLKRKGEKTTSAQLAWIGALKRSGAEVYIWKPSDWERIYQVLSDYRGPSTQVLSDYRGPSTQIAS